jgi:hypothetical protein
MRIVRTEKEDVQEFAAFIAAEPVAPRRATDEAVLRLVEKSIRPTLLPVLGKLTFVQAAAGLGTLALCPQFEIGFGAHNEILHALHAWTGPLLLYLFCGIFFVLLGAALGGILLRQDEMKTLGNSKYLYFVAYSVAALVIFLALGAEVLLVGSLLWIGGAVLGNMVGLAMGARLRTALTG